MNTTRPVKPYRFPDCCRIKKRSDFLRIQSSGKKLYTSHFLIILIESGFPTSRLGVTITKRVDKRASRRNYLKRCLRELFRLNRTRLIRPFDMIIIARQNAGECLYNQMEGEILGALARHKFLN